MKDQTLVEVAGMTLLAVLGTMAMIVDGDIGQDVAIAVGAGIGMIMGHVYGSQKAGDKDAEEV